MDAYSYLARGQVFANAQTGNMLLFGVNLASGQFQHALHYLCPVLAFGLGIFLAEFVHFQKIQKVHWRQVTLLIEIIILFGVGYFIRTKPCRKFFNFFCVRLTSTSLS